MVPPASSSIEGVFVFVLSPDEQQVLLVWEYGHWKVLHCNNSSSNAFYN
jgi:hypothetical protein